MDGALVHHPGSEALLSTALAAQKPIMETFDAWQQLWRQVHICVPRHVWQCITPPFTAWLGLEQAAHRKIVGLQELHHDEACTLASWQSSAACFGKTGWSLQKTAACL